MQSYVNYKIHIIPIFLCFIISLCFVTTGTTSPSESVQSLNGVWQFTFDPNDIGRNEEWFHTAFNRSAWRTVQVPHTWQVEPGCEAYMGIAWYARTIEPHPEWRNQILRLEFDSVYRDVQIWINGRMIGEHLGSGWTSFSFHIQDVWQPESTNDIVLRVDNRFSKNALPYDDSFDWAADGGIIRGVRLRVLPPIHIAKLLVQGIPYSELTAARVDARLILFSTTDSPAGYILESELLDPAGVRAAQSTQPIPMHQKGQWDLPLQWTVSGPKLWHFDRPQQYRMKCRIVKENAVIHETESTFGIRSVEVKDGFYYLNGEPMRLMGVEWMPGSDPRYGMAEPRSITEKILADMKHLNCIITRFHWQQDPSVLEFCDREGILLQEEIPSWGGKTMEGELDAVQAQQMEEMILNHYNHPSIYAWGLCNEIAGQTEKGHRFVQRGIDIARRLDPHRLLTYASNTLQGSPEKDAAGLLDFIEWNDYYESWYGGGLRELRESLKRIHAAFPEKSIVISEYGLCECSPNNPVGDEYRIQVMRNHTNIYRETKGVAGAIFFDYNDYRTHIGDKGQGAFKQRVHGVVDLFSKIKTSWLALREECSPIRELGIIDPSQTGKPDCGRVEILTRALENDLPAYTLRDYTIVWIAYNHDLLPIGTEKRTLPALSPGTKHIETFTWPTSEPIERVSVEIFRPTGYSVHEAKWLAPES